MTPQLVRGRPIDTAAAAERGDARSIKMDGVGGIGVRFEGLEEAPLRRLADLWRCCFAATDLSAPAAAAGVCVTLLPAAQPLRRRHDAELLLDATVYRIFRSEDGYFLECGATTLLIQPAQGKVTVSLAARFWALPLAIQRACFIAALSSLLHARERYALHAAGLQYRGRGYLVVGNSGCGKTTLAIALTRQGWGYLSDDTLLLWQMEPEVDVEALAFRRDFAYRPGTAAYFPELPAGPSEMVGDGVEQRLLEAERYYPGQFVAVCRPSVLLFPELTGEQRSRLEPMGQAATLAALMRQSVGLLQSAASARRQLALLGRLLAQASSYRLLAGRVIVTQPATAAALLCSEGGYRVSGVGSRAW